MCPKDNKGVKGLEGTAHDEQLKISGLLSFERRVRGDLVSWFRLLAGLKHDTTLLPTASSRGGAREMA